MIIILINIYKKKLVLLYNRDMYPPYLQFYGELLSSISIYIIFTMEIDFDTPYPPLLKVDLQ